MSLTNKNEDLIPILPFDKLNNWIYCICVVTFDIELGQSMERIYPKHIKLSDSEKSNVNYLSFPDSNSGCMGDTKYHFRFRCKNPVKRHTLDHNSIYPDSLKPSNDFCYGFVNFRQIKDKSIRRGYFQKSVVILSPLPFINLFYKVAEIVALAYYDDGDIGLECAILDIDKWVPPIAGQALALPLRGIVIQIQIPVKDDWKCEPNGNINLTKSIIKDVERKTHTNMTANNDLVCDIMSVQNLDCYSAFMVVINQLQLLWEVVLTNQPLIVVSNSPVYTSLVVQSLVAIISPLQFSQEFRPFFTIHDSEFKEFTAEAQSPPQIILGITNPFFIKALSHWPNVLKITDTKLESVKLRKMKNPRYLLQQEEIKPGLYSTYKPFLQTDKSLLKSLQKGAKIERPDHLQSDIIRKFFLELTQSFIFPLERYVASLMPFQKQIVAFKKPPSLRKFNIDDFFKTLENGGPQLTSGIKGDWIGLYRLFYSSPNFVTWLYQRQNEINVQLQQIHTEIMCRTNVSHWITDKPEIEKVDFIIQIKSKLQDCKVNQTSLITNEQERILNEHIKTIILSLPPDLQDMIRQSKSIKGSL